MGKKSRGNGEGTIYKREIHGKIKWKEKDNFWRY